MGTLKTRYRGAPKFFCVLCGVDSTPTALLSVLLVGGVVGAFLCTMIWAYRSGKFSGEETLARLAVEAENNQEKDLS